MKPELYEFLQEFRKEADEVINDCFSKVRPNTGLDGYSMLRSTSNLVMVDKYYVDYNKLFKAFGILSSSRIEEEYRRDAGIELNTKEFDKNETMKDIVFGRDNIVKMAKYIIEDDHERFFLPLKLAIGNRSLAERYTREIFGKAPKHY